MTDATIVICYFTAAILGGCLGYHLGVTRMYRAMKYMYMVAKRTELEFVDDDEDEYDD